MKKKYWPVIILATFIFGWASALVEAQELPMEDFENLNGYKTSKKEALLSKFILPSKAKEEQDSTPFYINEHQSKKYGLSSSFSFQGKSGYEYHEHDYLGMNIPLAAVTDTDGNTYLTGISSNENSPEGNYFTLKVDANGTTVWEKREEGAPYTGEAGLAIALDANDNPVVSGMVWNGNDMDIKTITYEASSGSTVWHHTFDSGHQSLDIPTTMYIDNAGNIAIAGITHQDDAIRYLVLHFDNTGTLVWSAVDTQAFAETWNEPMAITKDASGNVVVTGFGAVEEDSEGFWEGYLTIKYDTSGNETWRNTYLFERLLDEDDPTSGMTNTHSTARGIAVDATENIYVTGTFDISSKRTGTIKYAASGAEEWVETHRAGSTNTAYTDAYDVEVHDNTVYVGGKYVYDWVDEGTILISYDTTGAENWIETHDLTQPTQANLLLDADGLPILTGWGYDENTFDHRIRSLHYDASGTVLNSASYAKPQSDTEGIMNLVHTGLDADENLYLALYNFYTITGGVFETVKMAVNAGDDNTDWEETYGNIYGSNTRILNTVCDTDNNTYATGDYGIIEDDTYIRTFFVTQYNEDGDVMWEKTFNSLNGNPSDGIVTEVDSEGNVVVFLLPNPQADYPLRIKKYSSNGDLLWEEEKELHAALLRAFVLDTDDNIYIGGSSKEEETDPNPVFTVMKFSANGDVLWTDFSTTATPSDFIYELNAGTIAADGSILFTGAAGQATMFSEEVDIAVLSYTANGTLEWLNTYPQPGFSSSGLDLTTDSVTGDIYLCGVQLETVELKEELVALKLASNGDALWTTSYGQSDIGRRIKPYSIQQDSQGDLIIPSYSLYWVNGEPTNNRITSLKLEQTSGDIAWVNNSELHRYYADSYLDGADNFYILNQMGVNPLPYRIGFGGGVNSGTLLEVSPDGSEEGEEFFMGPELSDFSPGSLTSLPNGTLLLGGTLSHELAVFSGLYFFESTHNPLNAADFEPIGDTTKNWLGQNYPNPVKTNSTIPFYLASSSQVTIRLYNHQGQEIEVLVKDNFDTGHHTVSFQQHNLNPGIYFYQIEAGSFVKTRKMLIK